MSTLSSTTTTYLSPSGDHRTMRASEERVQRQNTFSWTHSDVKPAGGFKGQGHSLCLMFLMNADLPLIRFHVLNRIKQTGVTSDAVSEDWCATTLNLPQSFIRSYWKSKFSRRVDGQRRDMTSEEEWEKKHNFTTVIKNTTLFYFYLLGAYWWALMDFRHSHFLVLHTHRSPSSPPLSRWDDP